MTSHRLTDGSYLVRRAMELCIGQAVGQVAPPPGSTGDFRVLDIGGRGRPYAPLLASRLGPLGRPLRHIVVDAGEGGDLRALAEALPVLSGSADLVLCTQVLEHVRDPAAAVAEMARSLRPGGSCVLTTHGSWFYHPDPEDYWRWTAAGLRSLFSGAGFARVEVTPVGGTRLALTVLALNTLQGAAGEGLAGALSSRAVVAPINLLARGPLLRRVTERQSLAGELVVNYLVRATRT